MKKKNRIIITAVIAVLSVSLAISIGFNLNTLFWESGRASQWISYLQSADEIYTMESGILHNVLAFRDGEAHVLSYDFDNPMYDILRQRYDVEAIARSGSEFEKAKNLMNEFAGRLTHKSNYDNHVEMNAPALLEYSLDNEKNGINCRSKAQILNEMCLALHIYARKVWILPNSVYDGDCHVVNEVWDSVYNKWIMLDITNNMYWVDESGNPLSILEIREKIANREFCTPVFANEALNDLQKSLENNYSNFLYIAKNLVWMQYCETYTTDETNIYTLLPENLNRDFDTFLSLTSVKAPPKSE